MISETEYQTELMKLKVEAEDADLKLMKDKDQLKVDQAAITAKKLEELQKQAMDNLKLFVSTSLSAIEKNIENTISNIDHLQTLQQASIAQQTQLAIAGKQNDLAFELAQQDKLEKQRLIGQVAKDIRFLPV